MVPIISIVGKTNSGKTTLIEKIMPELKKRGYKIGAIKHCHHSFEIDHEGKDSYRMSEAGADEVVIATGEKIAMIRSTVNAERSTNIDEVISWLFQDVDIVITEGYKENNKPKIEVNRKEVGEELLCSEDGLFALVSDQKINLNVRCFGFDEVENLVNLIEEKLLKKGGNKNA